MQLYVNTVSNLLWKSLVELMKLNEFDNFRLVGGTSLSLQLGHRKSEDIDLFTDAEYGSIDFHELLENFSLNEMIDFYIKRYPYNFNREEIIKSLTNFEKAEYEFTPICFKDKVWEIIKLDIDELVKNSKPKG